MGTTRGKDESTVETSLEMLSEALSKASADLCVARLAIDNERCDIETRNTSVPRRVVSDAERVVQDLRHADEHLRDVVKDLQERD
jgi:hypothetical protein